MVPKLLSEPWTETRLVWILQGQNLDWTTLHWWGRSGLWCEFQGAVNRHRTGKHLVNTDTWTRWRLDLIKDLDKEMTWTPKRPGLIRNLNTVRHRSVGINTADSLSKLSQCHCFLQRPPQDKRYITPVVRQPAGGALIFRLLVCGPAESAENRKTKRTNCSFNVSPLLNVTSFFIRLNLRVKTCRRSEVFLCWETGALVNNVLKTPRVVWFRSAHIWYWEHCLMIRRWR